MVLRILAAITLLVSMVAPLWATSSDDAGKLLGLAGAGKVAEIRSMLDRGVDPNARFSKGYTTALHRAVEENQLEVILLLIERGADINAETSYGTTPLVRAATAGHEEALRLLHARGAALDHRTQGGSTALSLVSSSEPIRPNMVRVLLELGANPNIPDNSGRTPLHWVAQDANVEIIKLLLSNPKTELSKLDNDGYTPLYYAKERSRWFAKTPEDTKATVAMLERAGAKELAMNPVRIWQELKSSLASMFVSH